MLVEVKPIKSETDYEEALAEIEKLFAAKPGTPEADRLEILTALVEDYEDQHHSIPLPHPVEAIFYYLESRGLTRKDLELYLGSRARVSEILNRKRPLSLEMIRKLHQSLGIPAEVLIQRYEVLQSASWVSS
ncbi:MAG: helix-turn-helix domain-containing protein [Chloroflexi bacterium]|nr:helix-turn-helix domain-containing protein [Chloroflexota bacterium]